MGAGASAEAQQVPLKPEEASQKKQEGNDHFKAEAYLEAELAYSEAISLVSDVTSNTEGLVLQGSTPSRPVNSPFVIATLWSNRSAARMKLGHYGEALSDALVAISLNPRWHKAYWRAGEAAAALLQWQLAREYLLRAQILTNGADATVNDLLEKALAKRPNGIQDGPGSLLLWGNLPSKLNGGISGQFNVQRPKYVDQLRGKFVTEVAAGAMHTLALTPHGVYAWGSNTQGQCGIGVAGIGSTSSSSSNASVENNCIECPQLIPSLLGITISTISCGVGHSCAIDQRGVLWTWGLGGQGQLGLGERLQCVPTPTAVLSLSNKKHRVRAVSCGIAHTFVVTTNMITEEKCLLSFGWNHCGQLGHGGELISEQLKSPTLQPPRIEDTVPTPTKVIIQLGSGVTDDPVQQVSCGGAHTAIVTRSGRTFVTGSGSSGQLGLGDSSVPNDTNIGAISSFQEIPSKLLNNHKIAFVCAGEEFTCLVTKDDQEVFAFGLGNHGQLGDGQSMNRNVPTLVEGMSGKGTISLVSGKTSTMALTDSGDIYVWGGLNEEDQYMNTGSSDDATSSSKKYRLPQLLSGIRKKRVRQLEIGRSHYCSLLYATSPELSYIIHKKKIEKRSEGVVATIQLGRRYKFQVQAIDDGGEKVEAGSDQFHVKAVDETSGGISFADATFDDNFDGTYQCSIQPKVLGMYSVQVQLCGIHILGSPFELQVKDDKNENKEIEEKQQLDKETDAKMKKRKELMVTLRRQEMTRRRAKEALLRAQRERKADEARERRRKKQKRCGGGFVVNFSNDEKSAPVKGVHVWGEKTKD
jgi:alpha-tubulin suppressor-like RCC1 family protein